MDQNDGADIGKLFLVPNVARFVSVVLRDLQCRSCPKLKMPTLSHAISGARIFQTPYAGEDL